jgi:DNA-binding Xre family transcriptional regulator
MMSKKQQWVDLLHKIREEKMISVTDLCREIGISINTYQRFIEPDTSLESISYGTMRKINSYIQKYDGD